MNLSFLLLQAGGGVIDDSGNVIIDSEYESSRPCHYQRLVAGPDRIADDAPNFAASGNQMKISGKVLCAFMPDWMGDVWKHEMPELAGKIKLYANPSMDSWRPPHKRLGRHDAGHSKGRRDKPREI